jgi:sugar/nucleoside kinase (ribokinase family)
MCEFFDRCGVPSVAIKLGEKGAVMGQSGEFYTCPGFKVNAVDTTGAGDAFDAGFIHALLDKASPDRCLAVACACGALSTREPGALHALPSAEELESRL